MEIGLIRKRFLLHGGAERFTSTLAKELIKRKHDVHVYASAWDNAKGVTYHDVPVLPFGGSFFKAMMFAFTAKLELIQEPCDIVINNEKVVAGDIYRAGDGCHREWLKVRKQYISSIRAALQLISPFHLLMRLLEKQIFTSKLCKKYIAISEMVKKDIMNNYDVPAKDIKVIYNGVDSSAFRPAVNEAERENIRKEFGYDKNHYVILFVGSCFERKGLKFLLQAFAQLNSEKARLLVVGKGNKNKYSQYLKGIEDKVQFTGIIEDREKVFRAADVFAFPTLYEPFGNVQLEALASGLPVITTSRSGAAEIIEEDVHGYVVEKPEDVDDIAKHLRTLAKEGKRKAMGAAARELAQKFPVGKNVSEILELCREVQEIKHAEMVQYLKEKAEKEAEEKAKKEKK